jgi:pimeloyl-ACP methyl ester carboxylesterase
MARSIRYPASGIRYSVPCIRPILFVYLGINVAFITGHPKYLKVLLTILKIAVVVYVLICVLLYFLQEKLIFFPGKLAKEYQFAFEQPFEERYIKMADGKSLHGLFFKANNAKRLIFYLHGNAGSLGEWGYLAKTYTDLQYDVFMLDYRGYGKSEGAISSQAQLYRDIQLVYEEMKKAYREDNIVVLGYSIGSGLATYIAATNKPKLLILQAPYYSLVDMMRHQYPIVPTFILKYRFETNKYIAACTMPVVLFHGDKDELIYYKSSLKLQALFKPTDTLITLTGQGHNEITENPAYQEAIRTLLGNRNL